MTMTEQLREVAKRLLAKTKSGQVNWRPHDTKPSGASLFLDNSSIHVSYISPKAEADIISLDLLRHDLMDGPESSATLRAYVDDPEADTRGSTTQDIEDSLLLTELYTEATKAAYKWDDLFADIDQALAQPGLIGVAEDSTAITSTKKLSQQEPAHAQRR